MVPMGRQGSIDDEEVLVKHHTFAAAMGLLTALLIPGGPSVAASSDPTGFWTKQEASDYPAKMEIRKCGKGQLCAKIIWLQVSTDSKGKILHDVRNEDPSMRDRPILNLPIFNGLSPAGPGVWTGDIYNPEDGHIYTRHQAHPRLAQPDRDPRLQGVALMRREDLDADLGAAEPCPREPEQQEAKAQETPTPKPPMVEAAAEGTAARRSAALVAADPPSPPMPTPKPNHSAAPTAPGDVRRERPMRAPTPPQRKACRDRAALPLPMRPSPHCLAMATRGRRL